MPKTFKQFKKKKTHTETKYALIKVVNFIVNLLKNGQKTTKQIEMCSTYNEGKLVGAENFFRTLTNNVSKNMMTVPKIF